MKKNKNDLKCGGRICMQYQYMILVKIIMGRKGGHMFLKYVKSIYHIFKIQFLKERFQKFSL